MNDNSNNNDHNNKKKSNSNGDSSDNGDNGKNGNKVDIRYNRYILKNNPLVINKPQFEFGLKCAVNSDEMKNNIDILAPTIVKGTIFTVTKKQQKESKS